MKNSKLALALTIVNLALLAGLLARTVSAAPEPDAVLRGRALEIVDEKGRVRASIKVQPAGKTPDGAPYSETVMFRLIGIDGRPGVKLGAGEDGAGLGLIGTVDAAHALLKAEGRTTLLKLGREGGPAKMIVP